MRERGERDDGKELLLSSNKDSLITVFTCTSIERIPALRLGFASSLTSRYYRVEIIVRVAALLDVLKIDEVIKQSRK